MEKIILQLLFSIPILLICCSTPPEVQEEIEDPVDVSSQMNGLNIATGTQITLGRNLMNAINSGGTEYAIEFCSTKAIPLTDSVALSLNASIKRVSDKNRNPNNFPNDEEMSYILSAKQAMKQGKAPEQIVKTVEGREIGYYPIITNGMCLQCHGQPKIDISLKTLSKLNELYPNDLATGYKPAELRGIWVVELDKK